MPLTTKLDFWFAYLSGNVCCAAVCSLLGRRYVERSIIPDMPLRTPHIRHHHSKEHHCRRSRKRIHPSAPPLRGTRLQIGQDACIEPHTRFGGAITIQRFIQPLVSRLFCFFRIHVSTPSFLTSRCVLRCIRTSNFSRSNWRAR